MKFGVLVFCRKIRSINGSPSTVMFFEFFNLLRIFDELLGPMPSIPFPFVIPRSLDWLASTTKAQIQQGKSIWYERGRTVGLLGNLEVVECNVCGIDSAVHGPSTIRKARGDSGRLGGGGCAIKTLDISLTTVGELGKPTDPITQRSLLHASVIDEYRDIP